MMMNLTELQNALRELQGERLISFEMLLEALEAALISAYRRNYGAEANAIVVIDRETGEYRVYHRRTVVDEVLDPKIEIAKKEAGARYEPGDFYDEEVTPKNFGRIAAQTAKQVIVQRIREAERDTVYNSFNEKLHDLVVGTVQRYEHRNMFVEIGKAEAILPLSEQVPRENFRINDRVLAYVLDVRKTSRGPQVVISRAAEGLVQRLLEREVPEIANNTVEIMGIAREAGSRTKVAVHSNRPEIDPVGACLGPKSTRIAGVSDELRGEKIDVIRWSSNVAEFIKNALAPAKVTEVELYVDDDMALVIVPDYQFPLAIGRDGQNVRLASRLSGWRINITSESEADETRARYLHDRQERGSEGGAEDSQESEEPEEPEIDPELLRKLEEFRREMLDPDRVG
jgi:N utilization substance protein A